MREQGLETRHLKRWKKTTIPDPDPDPSAVDLVGRRFQPEKLTLNACWAGDITYVRTWEGWMYLATVIDLASRRVVGWAMADHMRADLVCEALEMALSWRRPVARLIFHSDRGSQPGLKGSTQRWPVEPRVGVRREPLLASSMRGSCAGDR